MQPVVEKAALTRATVWRLAIASLATGIAGTILRVAGAQGGFDAMGLPLTNDFHVYYAAAELGASGDLAAAFDPQFLYTRLKEQLPGINYGYYWLYPPAFALMILPLAALPFWAAFWLWTATGLAAYGASIWSVARDRLAVVAALAFPAVWLNAYHGQNGFFVAAFFGAAAYGLLHRRFALAGLAIGLLAIKPHLAVLFPLALAASGSWRAFFFAALSAVAFTLASIAVLGFAYIEGFLGLGAHYAQSLIVEGRHWVMMASVFAAMKLLGASTALAWAAHGAVAAGAAVLIAARFRANGLTRETIAMLAAASLLISPYVMNYDLVLLALPGVLLFAPNNGIIAPRWERFAALAIAMAPIVVVGCANLGAPIGWLAPVLTIALAEMRLRSHAAPSRAEVLAA